MQVKRIQKFKTLAEDLQSLIFPGRKIFIFGKDRWMNGGIFF